ncbi:MAG: hypothetical protein AAFW68_12090 [Pseudomonadota bacterium]
MPEARYDYGRAGFFGVLTPQANPTVEAEMRVLLPQDGVICSARCVSAAADSTQRLIDYFERLPETVVAFDQLKLDVAGFACTGSSYLLGAEREARLLSDGTEALGAPVISATQAIDEALRAAGVTTIAFVAPYPDALIDAGVRYWSAKGYRVHKRFRVDTGSRDTRLIYQLGSADALASVTKARAGVDAVLLSGTGMPTLALYADVSAPPIFSSNPCLAWAMRRRVGRDPASDFSVQELARRAINACQKNREAS